MNRIKTWITQKLLPFIKEEVDVSVTKEADIVTIKVSILDNTVYLKEEKL